MITRNSVPSVIFVAPDEDGSNIKKIIAVCSSSITNEPIKCCGGELAEHSLLTILHKITQRIASFYGVLNNAPELTFALIFADSSQVTSLPVGAAQPAAFYTHTQTHDALEVEKSMPSLSRVMLLSLF